MALTATFSGPTSPTNTINQQGTTATYTGVAPDFTVVIAALKSGTYELTVLNYGGVSGWGATANLSKSDGNPGDIIGTYAENGGTGTAEVKP